MTPSPTNTTEPGAGLHSKLDFESSNIIVALTPASLASEILDDLILDLYTPPTHGGSQERIRCKGHKAYQVQTQSYSFMNHLKI